MAIIYMITKISVYKIFEINNTFTAPNSIVYFPVGHGNKMLMCNYLILGIFSLEIILD